MRLVAWGVVLGLAGGTGFALLLAKTMPGTDFAGTTSHALEHVQIIVAADVRRLRSIPCSARVQNEPPHVGC